MIVLHESLTEDVLKPFLLDKFSFAKDVISTCFKSLRWLTVQFVVCSKTGEEEVA